MEAAGRLLNSGQLPVGSLQGELDEDRGSK